MLIRPIFALIIQWSVNASAGGFTVGRGNTTIVRAILFDRREHPAQLGEVFVQKSETSDNGGELSKRPSSILCLHQ